MAGRRLRRRLRQPEHDDALDGRGHCPEALAAGPSASNSGELTVPINSYLALLALICAEQDLLMFLVHVDFRRTAIFFRTQELPNVMAGPIRVFLLGLGDSLPPWACWNLIAPPQCWVRFCECDSRGQPSSCRNRNRNRNRTCYRPMHAPLGSMDERKDVKLLMALNLTTNRLRFLHIYKCSHDHEVLRILALRLEELAICRLVTGYVAWYRWRTCHAGKAWSDIPVVTSFSSSLTLSPRTILY